jgi:hypothetical protein
MGYQPMFMHSFIGCGDSLWQLRFSLVEQASLPAVEW